MPSYGTQLEAGTYVPVAVVFQDAAARILKKYGKRHGKASVARILGEDPAHWRRYLDGRRVPSEAKIRSWLNRWNNETAYPNIKLTLV